MTRNDWQTTQHNTTNRRSSHPRDDDDHYHKVEGRGSRVCVSERMRGWLCLCRCCCAINEATKQRTRSLTETANKYSARERFLRCIAKERKRKSRWNDSSVFRERAMISSCSLLRICGWWLRCWLRCCLVAGVASWSVRVALCVCVWLWLPPLSTCTPSDSDSEWYQNHPLTYRSLATGFLFLFGFGCVV